MTQQQRRGRAIAMTPGEVDDFLASERTCRVATVDAAGRPHVAPLWFVWDGSALWLYSLVRSKRWADISRSPFLAVVVDTGTGYQELRGVELRGRAEVIGEVPRTGAFLEELVSPEQLFAGKYNAQGEMPHDGLHAWLRVTPETLVSWDFRKLAGLRERR